MNMPAEPVWVGPSDASLIEHAQDVLRMFGPGTTDGGRAEAGWFDLGTIADDGLQFNHEEGTDD